ncbi:MAG: hypothetical protein ABI091_30060, partial [Ferruginibacter sp.]
MKKMLVKIHPAKKISFLVLLFCTRLVCAQVLIQSTDKLIRYDLIKPNNCYRSTVIYDTAGKIVNRFLSNYVTRIDTTKNEILFIRYTPWDIGKFSLDSSFNNSSGPLRYNLTNLPRTKEETIKFNISSVDSHLYRKGIYADKLTQMPSGYFDDTSVWDLFGFMELSKGTKYYLNVYDSDKRDTIKYFVEYIMDDMINGADGLETNCGVINIKYGNKDSFIWADKETHQLKKEIFSTPVNKV